MTAASDTSLASSGGLQRLVVGVHHFCSLSGLVISIAKMAVVNFHGPDIQGSFLPRSQSFKYLGREFHECGELAPMVRQLPPAGQGARAKFQAKFCRKGCSTSLPTLLRVFSTLFVTVICCGCGVWRKQFHGNLVSDAKMLQRAPVAFCATSVVACLLAILQQPFLLSCSSPVQSQLGRPVGQVCFADPWPAAGITVIFERHSAGCPC